MPNEFLHSHPGMEVRINLDEDHVIVDRADWLAAIEQRKEIDRLNVEIKRLNQLLNPKPEKP